jgi:two-component system, chemotaxis family, protein-glutamate methylesterase/glutaminase
MSAGLMTQRDIIVAGASLGGLDALTKLVSGLPADLKAAVFVVMHVTPQGPSHLAERLDAAGELPAAPAEDGETIRPGRIYVAVPDRHLMLEGERVRLSRGPRESHARPSVDVLFRSAAHFAGPRVIGIVLTGMLDDGTAGLWAIKDRGGIALVQSPAEAAYPSMPLNALRYVKADYSLKVAEMPSVLRALTLEQIQGTAMTTPNDKLEIENRISLADNALEIGVRDLGSPSFFTCPECHGSMVAIQEGPIRRFKCHTGHGFTEGSLSERAMPRIEDSLWGALAQLEERAVLLEELKIRNPTELRLEQEAREIRRLAGQLRGLLADPTFKRA